MINSADVSLTTETIAAPSGLRSKPRNLLIGAIAVTLFVVKTFMEEQFLSEDPTYARYMKVVRWRWIPGLA